MKVKKVLVIGSGGREHALVWKLLQSPKVDKVYCAPGNAGIAEVAICVDIPAEDITALLWFVREQGINLIVVGPEVPLCAGIGDAFRKEGHAIFGPGAVGAMLEGSKTFAKDFMVKYGIPTAEYKTFTNYLDAVEYILYKEYPIVIKADGLAAGKGVVVAETIKEADEALMMIMKDNAFGEAGKRVLIEKCLQGEEASFMILTDSRAVVPLETTQDHKRVGDGDTGKNTGGMGAYCPAPVVTEKLHAEIMATIIDPLLKGFRKEGIDYRGIVYVGVMVCDGKPYVLEFNVRFGDPETQPILMRLESDLFDLLYATAKGRLGSVPAPVWKKDPAVCVVPCAEGYPGTPRKGDAISGIREAEETGAVIFHAGTRRDESTGSIFTAGGRVLGVTALGKDIQTAKNNAYAALEKINFSGMHYRTDIADRAIKREEE